MEIFFVSIIVIVAGYYAVSSFRKSFKNDFKDDCGGCAGCSFEEDCDK